jgi:signal transduction histidine kinase/CheY-like chemotaxis protein
VRKLRIGALTLGVLLAIAGLRAADLWSARTDAIRAAESRAANLAIILGGYLGEAFAAGDASLRQLALHSRRVGGPSAPERSWGPSLASAKAGLTSISAITVVSNDGVIRHSTRPEIVGQSRRDDYIIRSSIGAPGDDLVVGTPFRTLRTPPLMIIPIGRRLLREDGTSDGAVVASFIPALPRRFFRRIDVGQRGTVWVFHPDGVVLFREPSTSDPIGESAKTNPLFIAASREGGSGALQAPVAADGRVMLSAFHSLSTPPLIVAVSLDRSEVLADWQNEVLMSAAGVIALALTLVATLMVLYRQMDAKVYAEQALAEAQQQESARLREANERLVSALERERIARREAEEASALKDQFLMTVSHELRTPLTAIYGWARMLVDGTMSDRQRDAAIRTIERNASAQTRLIDDLLDVAGVMGGKLRLDVQQVNIAAVVQSSVETITPAADAKGIRIETSVDPSAVRLSGDPERLQQIIWNLLANAVKFTPNGGRVRLTASRDGGDVRIVVSDTGIGISRDFLPHVFDRFRQEDAGTKRHYGGLGLGLAIVKTLVELHGGSVSAESAGERQGATFVVRLPASAASTAPQISQAVRTDDATSDSTRLDDVRVLVVDDDVEARTLFAAILGGAGAVVTCASSAAEAMRILRDAPHDVIVSDIEMPDVDGYGLVHQALAIAQERGDRLAAIAVTAYSRPEDEARSLAAGFHRHVQKPVEPSMLIAAVQATAGIWRRTSASDTATTAIANPINQKNH